MIATWTNAHLLSVIIFTPLLFSLILYLLPREGIRTARNISLFGTIISATFTANRLLQLNPNQVGHIYTESSIWLTAIGIPVDYNLVVDSLNIWLVLLTVFLMPIIIVGTWAKPSRHTNTVIALMLALETGILGVLVAQDLMIFYIFWSALQLPIFFLVTMQNNEEFKRIATILILFLTFGSISCLIPITVIAEKAGSFAIEVVAQEITKMPFASQRNAIFAFTLIFSAGIAPISTCIKFPNAKTKTPAAAFIIITVILLKLSSYGFIRFILPMFTNMVRYYSQTLAIISVITIIYGAIIAIMQTDAKKLIINLTVNQVGLTTLGASSMTVIGIQGAFYQIVINSISTIYVFFLITFLHRRTSTYNIPTFSNLILNMTIFTTFSILLVIVGIGVTLANSFMGEYMILSGVLTSSLSWRRTIVCIAVTGIITNIICTLLVVKRMFLYTNSSTYDVGAIYKLRDLNIKEIITMSSILVMLSFWVNFQPQVFLKQSEQQIKALLANNQNNPPKKTLVQYSLTQ